MATVTLTIPDTLVGAVLQRLRARYPDLPTGPGTDTAAGKEGIARLVREQLTMAEADRIAGEVAALAEAERQTRLATVTAAVAQIV